MGPMGMGALPRLLVMLCVALALTPRSEGVFSFVGGDRYFILRNRFVILTPSVPATVFRPSAPEPQPQPAGDIFEPPKAGLTVGIPGTSAERTISHPYAVSLRRRSDMGFFCAGVLVGKRFVLTAAHCVDSSRTSGDSQPQVVVGSESSVETSGPGVQVISTVAVNIHPTYRSRRFPDLAILELAFDANPTPIRLPTAFLPRKGTTLSAIGWGRLSASSANSELVQISNMGFVPRQMCAMQTGRSSIPYYNLCVGGNGVNSCEGDNGGPIFLPGQTRQDDVLVGIMGSNHVCGVGSRPDVHTNVWPYVAWMNSIIGAR